MKRRNFVKNISAGAITIPGAIGGFRLGFNKKTSWLKTLSNYMVETDHVLVMVRLDGGNDGLNTVIPLDQYDTLANIRETVVLPQNSILKLDGIDTVGLHPSMTGMQNLYNEGTLSIIQSVGYPNPNHSHFRSTDIWMTGADSDEVLTTGWMGRYMNYEYPNFPIGYPNEDVPDPLSIEFGGLLSLTFQGPTTGMGMAISSPDDFYNLVRGLQTPSPNTPAGEQLDYVRLIARQTNEYGVVVSKAYDKGTNAATYPNEDLAEQLKIVARLISGGLKTRVFMVSIGGFDTHSDQVDPDDHTEGGHAELLGNVSEAISAFMQDIESQGFAQKVTGMTFSEFGRRIISNFSDGTDHGAAAPMFLFGTQIQPGVIGDNPVLPPNANEDDNLPMQYDFRSIYSSLLKDWFCVPESDLQSIMLHDLQTLPLVNTADCISAAHDIHNAAGNSLISASPNPFVNSTKITFETNGGRTIVQIFNTSGKLIATPVRSKYAKGRYTIDWNSENLPAGTYYLRLQNGLFQQVKPIIKVR